MTCALFDKLVTNKENLEENLKEAQTEIERTVNRFGLKRDELTNCITDTNKEFVLDMCEAFVFAQAYMFETKQYDGRNEASVSFCGRFANILDKDVTSSKNAEMRQIMRHYYGQSAEGFLKAGYTPKSILGAQLTRMHRTLQQSFAGLVVYTLLHSDIPQVQRALAEGELDICDCEFPFI